MPWNLDTVVVIVAMLLTLSSMSYGQECESLLTCSECITRNSSCAWCNDEVVFQLFASEINGQLEAAKLCGTPDDLSDIGCIDIVNPVSTVEVEEVTGDMGSGDITLGVSPELVNVKLRPGVKERVEVLVAPPESISVDMYVLMDLSFTMNDDLDGLRDFGEELVELMQSLTDEFRIGFGSFVDKPVAPFGGRLNLNTPCNQEDAAIASQCVPTYAFRHHLDFTSDPTLFTNELNSASISGSEDDPEALFDALLQVAVCEDEIGWRPLGTTRRIVLAMTDGDYHTALDGTLAGILRKPTTECKLNPQTKFYEYASQVDYPSSSFLADVMNEFRITPIFAARRRVRALYEDLRAIIRSAFIGEISDSSTNLLNLINDQYRTLSTTVIPSINGANDIDELTVEATPLNQCGKGNVSSTRTDTCENVVFPNQVTYELSFEATPSFCNRLDSGLVHPVQVLFIGFGVVTINVSVQCSCPCESNRVEMSSNCSGRGTYECSTCICDDSYVGATCSCLSGVSAVFGCTNRDVAAADSVCSGRGDCLCSECQCHSVPGLTGEVYQGRYCECDPFACPLGADDNGQVIPCSGHGTCGCDNQCECDEGYSGSSCDCLEDTSTCRREGDDDFCSGAGLCRCGVCVCDDYSERRGRYCEECVTCRGSCSVLSECVECLISGGCGPEMACDNITLTHSLEAIPNFNNTNFEFRNCSVANSNCEVVYQVDQNVVGVEGMVVVFVNDDQRNFITWTESPNDCEPSPNLLIYIIPVVIVIVIIIIAIVAVVGWKIITVLAEYSEYKAWERSQEREKWNTSGENPLFVAATTEHTNPKYRRPVHAASTGSIQYRE